LKKVFFFTEYFLIPAFTLCLSLSYSLWCLGLLNWPYVKVYMTVIDTRFLNVKPLLCRGIDRQRRSNDQKGESLCSYRSDTHTHTHTHISHMILLAEVMRNQYVLTPLNAQD